LDVSFRVNKFSDENSATLKHFSQIDILEDLHHLTFNFSKLHAEKMCYVYMLNVTCMFLITYAVTNICK